MRDFLPSVVKHTHQSTDIYFVDNASTDNSIAIAEGISSRIKIIALNENHGFAGGYNEGLKQIEADIYILLNSDIEVTPNWELPLIDAFKDRTVGAAIGKIKAYARKDYFEYAGAAGGYLDRHGYAFCRGRIFDTVEVDNGQYDDPVDVAWGSGCALAIRSTLFHGLGGFDAAYFAHYEEIDLCWRIRRAGYRIPYIATSVVYHLGGGTLNYDTPNKTYLNFRNSLYTLYKNKSGFSAFTTIFSRMTLDGVAAMRFLTQGKFAFIWAILRSHIAFYTGLAYLRKRDRDERIKIQDYCIGKPDISGESNKSIIVEYFFRGKKTFSSIFTS